MLLSIIFLTVDYLKLLCMTVTLFTIIRPHSFFSKEQCEEDYVGFVGYSSVLFICDTVHGLNIFSLFIYLCNVMNMGVRGGAAGWGIAL